MSNKIILKCKISDCELTTETKQNRYNRCKACQSKIDSERGKLYRANPLNEYTIKLSREREKEKKREQTKLKNELKEKALQEKETPEQTLKRHEHKKLMHEAYVKTLDRDGIDERKEIRESQLIHYLKSLTEDNKKLVLETFDLMKSNHRHTNPYFHIAKKYCEKNNIQV